MHRIQGLWLLSLATWSVVALSTMGCAGEPHGHFLDLTYAFDEHTLYWPNNKRFQWEKTNWGETAGGYWYSAAMFAAAEHGGTHIDAPIHFGRDRRSVDQIPVNQLTGPASVIDVRTQCQADADYELTVEDIQGWEARYGPIPKGAIVLMLSGWGSGWPDPRRYFGTPQPDDAATFHFPGFSRAAAEFLVSQRDIHGIGIDTPSIDPGRSQTFPVHQVINDANLYGLENVAGLEQVPPRGATLYALPMKIKGGTGGPVRIIARMP